MDWRCAGKEEEEEEEEVGVYSILWDLLSLVASQTLSNFITTLTGEFEIPETDMPFPKTPLMHSSVSLGSPENLSVTGFLSVRCPEMRQ